MDIDIYILNLPRDTHRFDLCYKDLCAKGVPTEKIHTWVANDDRDYEKTREVCEAAIADGFSEFQRFLDRDQHNKYNIAIFTQSWNYCRFFRHLIDEQKTALLIHDDVMLGDEMTYQVLNEMVECLHNRDEIFRYFTLWRFWGKERFDPKPISENLCIAQGVCTSGSDMAQVITPLGAEFLLENFAGHFPPQLENLINDLNQVVGFYTIDGGTSLSCKRTRHKSNIFNPSLDDDKYLRPIKTTWDSKSMYKDEDIDVYILNVPREIKRRYITEGALRAKSVPPSKTHIWEANDDRDYEKTRQVCEAAIADGFPEFQARLDNGQHNEHNIAHLTQSWNYCRFFRHLIDEQKTALLIHDDVMFGEGMTYQVLNEIVECLHNRDEVFRYFTLWIRWFNRKESFDPKSIPENPHITRGIYSKGCDMAQVITPHGAEFLLSKFEGYFFGVLEDLIFHQLGPRVGFYTVIDETSFACRKSTRESTIRSAEGFVRPIDTTMD